MQQRLEFVPEEHTDYVFSVIVDDWRPLILVVVAAVGFIVWLIRRRRRRGSNDGPSRP